MQRLTIQEASARFSTLIDSVEKGEEIVISRHGEPVAKLVPFGKRPVRRVPGSAKGKFTVPQDFFKPLPDEIMEAFEK